jgi:hypothetical protein
MYKNSISLYSSLLGLLLVVVSLSSCTDQEPEQPAGREGIEIVSFALAAMDAEGALGQLAGLSFRSDRDYYIMGQGPEPGHGLMRLAHSEMTVQRDTQGDRLRLDTVTRNAARGGGYTERKSHQ